MGLRVKRNSLVPRVIAGHVALATVDTHFLIYNSLDLLCVVQLPVCTDVLQSPGYNILDSWDWSLGGVRSGAIGLHYCGLLNVVSHCLLVVGQNLFLLKQIGSKAG